MQGAPGAPFYVFAGQASPRMPKHPPASTPADILRTVFGYASFQGQQEEIITHVAGGGDAVVLMPTGGGKSLCYQIPALLRPGLGVVVSPLIALMQDQVGGLRQMGVAAACLNSSLTPAAARGVVEAMLAGRLDLLYVAPERAVRPDFLHLLGRVELALFAIDEAHCVSQWGHDFRPEYRELAVLGRTFPGVPRIALTATADEPTRRDILSGLDLHGAALYCAGFDRPNLRYSVKPKDHPFRQLTEFIRREHPGEAGIVYCLSRRKVEETAARLAREGLRALPYHAGLPLAERERNMDAFMREEGLIMVATVAFGMGVDKPNVRFVAHLDPPRSLEAYHQETGRAGRDGLPADAWMVYGLQDIVAMRAMLRSEEGQSQGSRDHDGRAHKRLEARKLDALLGYCEAMACRRTVLLGYFGENYPGPCNNCDCCLEPPDTFEGTVAAQKALSNVFRTGQRFGAGHLTDVLLGRASPRVLELGHDRLSTFGIGAELDRDGWMSVHRQLAAAGYLAADPDSFGGLRLTPRSWEVLKHGKQVRFRRDSTRAQRRAASAGGRGLPATGEARSLLTKLKELRMALAREHGVPPYAIFPDRTLLDFVRLRPDTLSALREAFGVGERKAERFGPAFLALLEAHAAEYGKPAPPPAPKPTSTDSGDEAQASQGARRRGDSARESLELFRELGSVEAVSARRALKASTIWSHLTEAVALGELEGPEVSGLHAEEYACLSETLRLFALEGFSGLKPAYEALGEVYSYELLRMVWADINHKAGME